MNIAMALAHQPLCDLVIATFAEMGIETPPDILELRGGAPHGVLSVTGALNGTLSLAVVGREYKLNIGAHAGADQIINAISTLKLCAERLYSSMCRYLTESVAIRNGSAAKWNYVLHYSSESQTLYFDAAHEKRMGIVFQPHAPAPAVAS